MLDKLRAGDINAAMYAINANGYDKYLAVFNALAPNLSAIVDQLGSLQTGIFSTRSAVYPLVRDTVTGQEGFSINFLRGEDGVWRIDSM
jgi:hypothetical protein